ncbi:aminoacetone oxidase family FAD-binding enzyme, partial [Patescibacteria group bacterium]|nr:aminoacetone oxidase family FAD-binding enzyme [Patescibacteria group bacterium]
LKHYGKNFRFLKPAFSKFSNKDLIKFFEEKGLAMITQTNGKIFPKSLQAKDALDVLTKACPKISYNEKILNAKKIDKHFEVKTNLKTYTCQKLIIATGGKSYPHTGSTGDGYSLAKSFGHTIIEPRPALSPIRIRNYKFQDLSGVSLPNISISLYRDNKKIQETVGDLLFTHTGLSGPGILNFSRYIHPHDTLKINFTNLNPEKLKEKIIAGKFSLKDLKLPKSLTEALNLPKDLTNLSKQDRNLLIQNLCAHPFEVQSIGNFEIAMVTAGGVSLKEVSPKTMQSHLVEGLYFTGEILDIDGDTGGYNLQAAFSTAYLACKNQSIKV